jgi:hypothetical protein
MDEQRHLEHALLDVDQTLVVGFVSNTSRHDTGLASPRRHRWSKYNFLALLKRNKIVFFFPIKEVVDGGANFFF